MNLFLYIAVSAAIAAAMVLITKEIQKL